MDEADEPALRKVGGKARGGCGERLQLTSELYVDALILQLSRRQTCVRNGSEGNGIKTKGYLHHAREDLAREAGGLVLCRRPSRRGRIRGRAARG